MITTNNEFVSDDMVTQVVQSMEQPPLEEVLEAPIADTWEYKVVLSEGHVSIEAEESQLHLLGLARWELVYVLRLEIPFDNQLWYYLKRKRLVQGAENGE
jgi:hypothetical protein